MENISFSNQSHQSINQNQIQILSSKKESSFLSSLWEKFINVLKSNEEEVKAYEPRDSIRKPLCKCPKTKCRDYCDNIYDILQMTKNNKIKDKSKELYQNLLKINDKALDLSGDNLCQIQKGF